MIGQWKYILQIFLETLNDFICVIVEILLLVACSWHQDSAISTNGQIVELCFYQSRSKSSFAICTFFFAFDSVIDFLPNM